MNAQKCLRTTVGSVAAAAGVGAAAYAAYVGVAWSRYGHVRRLPGERSDALLDRFMPAYDVVDRHHVEVRAPAADTLAAACELDMSGSRIIRALFRGRELIVGATHVPRSQPRGLLAEVQALGWAVLDEIPDREIVIGAVTRPWEANVTFRAVPPDQFAGFSERRYVKIVWTLRADPVGGDRSILRTETRAVATDPSARATFRVYWAFLSPGIIVIRRVMLRAVKAAAERRVQAASA